RLLHDHSVDIPEIFGQKLQLYMHYPDSGENPIFHSAEVQSFYTVIGRYYARNAQLARALKCYFIVENADHEGPHLEGLAKEIFIAEAAYFFTGAMHQIRKEPDSNE
ncbi:MAG: hypothetical protein Q9M19_06080, partial [Mariprofundaceae bacterium]|nr:hypothetical protein [Mariprofundaceae bacterium]